METSICKTKLKTLETYGLVQKEKKWNVERDESNNEKGKIEQVATDTDVAWLVQRGEKQH